MSAFDLLTEQEKEYIKDYIIDFGPTDYESFETCRMNDLDTILREWYTHKDQLLTMFGGNDLILRRPYSYLKQAEALSIEIEKQMNARGPYMAFREWYDGKVVHNAACDIEVLDIHGESLANRRNYFYSRWYQFNDCMTSMSLAANAYMGEDCIIKFLPSGRTMKLFKGMKPMKILHRLVQEFNGDENIFEAFRIWHSMLFNQKCMDGELCLSIHPLDYMTMSDNSNGWKSCMRWTDDGQVGSHGDYRSGTVQCMNSPYIIVAYLHNPEHKFYPFNDNTMAWNSKQWRELFIVQDGIINEIKGYPFQDENLTNTCLMWIKELAQKNLGWTYDNEEVDVGQPLESSDDKTVYISFDAGDFMYKDIGSIMKHRGRINKEKLFSNKYLCQESINPTNDHLTQFITVEYGGHGTCMSCGCWLPYERSERVMCDSCDTVQICACCGEPIYSEDEAYWIEDRDEPVCECCFENECVRDAFAYESEYHLTNNMTEIWLLLGYDKDNKPIFYDETAWTYEPEYEYSNFRSVCPDGYDTMDYDTGWFRTSRNYTTVDNVADGHSSDFCEAFNIWDRNLNRFYEKAVEDYNVVYGCNHDPLFPEEEEDDE